MSSKLSRVDIKNYTTVRGAQYDQLDISYQVFGQELHTAPVVVVYHALTGNSDVSSRESGWWRDIIDYDQVIDLRVYTVIAFNTLGNGYDGVLVDHYEDFTARDIAQLSYLALQQMDINHIHSCIGGSLGGGIAWELVAAYPDFCDQLVAVATDWKSTDWVIGFCGSQEHILLNSKSPLADARRMAMLFYRSAKSLEKKFNRELQNEKLFKVNSWLDHHGEKLNNRFSKKAYLMMNHLLSTIDIEKGRSEVFSKLKSQVIQVGVSSDLLFPPSYNLNTKKRLDNHQVLNKYYEIESDHGHDAFLIEHNQLSKYLKKHF